MKIAWRLTSPGWGESAWENMHAGAVRFRAEDPTDATRAGWYVYPPRGERVGPFQTAEAAKGWAEELVRRR